ncbi:unnamed protein product, partial [Allacma fusca]
SSSQCFLLNLSENIQRSSRQDLHL